MTMTMIMFSHKFTCLKFLLLLTKTMIVAEITFDESI